jgi:hypothetical protein
MPVSVPPGGDRSGGADEDRAGAAPDHSDARHGDHRKGAA